MLSLALSAYEQNINKGEKKKMENFEQLVRKTMKEYGIDGRLTNIILSNKSPEEITKAIEKAVIEIAE